MFTQSFPLLILERASSNLTAVVIYTVVLFSKNSRKLGIKIVNNDLRCFILGLIIRQRRTGWRGPIFACSTILANCTMPAGIVSFMLK